MALLFSAVARGSLVLAQFAAASGNFTDVTREVLRKVPPRDETLTYSSGNFHFHYISANKMVYFCISNDKFPREKAFAFLRDIKQNFLLLFGDTPSAAIPNTPTQHPSEGDFARILEKEMKRYNENKMSKAKEELATLKKVMEQNVDKMVQRGALIDDVLNRAEGLAQNTTTYVETSTKVQRKYWWQNVRMYFILGMIAPFLVYFIGASACGGFKWQKCFG